MFYEDKSLEVANFISENVHLSLHVKTVWKKVKLNRINSTPRKLCEVKAVGQIRAFSPEPSHDSLVESQMFPMCTRKGVE